MLLYIIISSFRSSTLKKDVFLSPILPRPPSFSKNKIYYLLIIAQITQKVKFCSKFAYGNLSDKKVTENLISENIVHELCHAARWGKNNEWTKSLFDGLIFEGIACVFEAEFVKDKSEKTLFIKTILERSDKENEEILAEVHDKLDSNEYDYDKILFNGDNKLPRWSGYSLGYYLVKKYLEKTDKKIEDAFADKYADYRIVL